MGCVAIARGIGTQWRGMEASNIFISNEGNRSEHKEENIGGRSVAGDPQAEGSFWVMVDCHPVKILQGMTMLQAYELMGVNIS